MSANDRHLHRGVNGDRTVHEHSLGEKPHTHPNEGHTRLDDVPPERAVCDFCSFPEPLWEYPCRTFTQPSTVPGLPEFGSRGSWLACQKCYDLIERDSYMQLLNRSLYRFIKAWGKQRTAEGEAALMHELSTVQQRFQENRIGPATRLEA